jgi:hypothetical protein
MSHSLQVRRAVLPAACGGRHRSTAFPTVRGDCSPRVVPPASAANGNLSRPKPIGGRIGGDQRRQFVASVHDRHDPRPVSLAAFHPARPDRWPSPLRDDETGKVGGTSRPRPRSSTFAPSCRRPPSSLSRRTAIRTSLRLPPRSILVRPNILWPRSISPTSGPRLPSKERWTDWADATNQCRSFGGSIAMRGGETLPPTGIVTNRGPLRFPPSSIRSEADQRPFDRRSGAILLGCAGLSSRKLRSRATRGKQEGRFRMGASKAPR